MIVVKLTFDYDDAIYSRELNRRAGRKQVESYGKRKTLDRMKKLLHVFITPC